MKVNKKVSHKDGVFKKLKRKSKIIYQKEVPNNTIPECGYSCNKKSKEVKAESPSETLLPGVRSSP